MVTSKIKYPATAFCTNMGCVENPCCNWCYVSCNWGLGYSAKFRNVGLCGKNIGCEGTNCDWREKCAYSHNDRVTVYGRVKLDQSGDLYIKLKQHCLKS